MTITYTGKVSTSKLMGFSKLLFYWKGSIYKLVYKEMIIFVGLYAGLSMLYHLILADPQKRVFEKVVHYFQNFLDLIPLTFVLGFYVSIVVKRWWDQYLSIPWPDRLACYVGTLITGYDERGRLIRRSLMRWVNLSSAIIFQGISLTVKKRFPTMQHLVNAGLMTQNEKKVFKNLPSPHNKFWIPCMWFCTLVNNARDEGRIKDEIHLKTILDELNSYKTSLGMLYSYDWISIPLVYTQVATLSVYSFFLACVMGRQYIDQSADSNHPQQGIEVPVFTLLQFFFYMGWLKVAEVLINPFGEDEDDFEMNWIIDRNYQVSMLAVDEMYDSIPPLEKDIYWDELEPQLPYTRSALRHKTEPFMGSTADFSLNGADAEVVSPMETIPEDAAVPASNHLQVPVTITSALSSPEKCRRYLDNIVTSVNYDTPNQSQEKLHWDGPDPSQDVVFRDHMREAGFAHSPLAERVRSLSLYRTHSHADELGRHGSVKLINDKLHRKIGGHHGSSPKMFHTTPVSVIKPNIDAASATEKVAPCVPDPILNPIIHSGILQPECAPAVSVLLEPEISTQPTNSHLVNLLPPEVPVPPNNPTPLISDQGLVSIIHHTDIIQPDIIATPTEHHVTFLEPEVVPHPESGPPPTYHDVTQFDTAHYNGTYEAAKHYDSQQYDATHFEPAQYDSKQYDPTNYESNQHVNAYDTSQPHMNSFETTPIHYDSTQYESKQHVNAYDTSQPHMNSFETTPNHYDSTQYESKQHVNAYDMPQPHGNPFETTQNQYDSKQYDSSEFVSPAFESTVYDSTDLQYESNYDTVNSQQPLLESQQLT